jgi:ferric-dicitrate binding protein FerR (iron transport regulator)
MRRHDEAMLWEYVKDEMPAEESALLENHFEECPECVEKLHEVKAAHEMLLTAMTAKPISQWAKVDGAIAKEIERRQAKSARGAWLQWVGLATAAAGLAVVAFYAFPMVKKSLEPAPVPVAVQQPAEEAHPLGSHIEKADGLSKVGANDVAAHDGDPLLAGDVLLTSRTGHGTFHLADESRVKLGAHSELTLLHASKSEVAMNLERGKVAIHASHAKRAGFVVRASGVAVKVVGTLFEVTNSGSAVDVAVAEGRVQVEPVNGAPFFVDAGQHVRLDAGKAKPTQGKLTPAEKNELSELLIAGDVNERPANPPAVAAAPAAVPAAGGNGMLPRLAKNDPRTVTHDVQPSDLPTRRDEVPLGDGDQSKTVENAQGQVEQPVAQQVMGPPPERPTGSVSQAPVLIVPAHIPNTGTPSDEGEWNPAPVTVQPKPIQAAPPVSAGQTEAAPPPFDEPKAGPPRALIPPVAKDNAELAVDAEQRFMRKASRTIDAGHDCRAYLLGLSDILEHNRRNERAEKALVLRARCYDNIMETRAAEQEYRRYLREFPGGPYAAEANKWLSDQ